MANIKPEFDRRGVKIIGLSVDPSSDHERWAKDIEETQATAPEERIDGAVNVPLPRLPEQLATLPRDHPIVVHCGSGHRSAIAASLLQRGDHPDVADLIGGMAAWQSSAAPRRRLASSPPDA